jgi:hypothetical protein
MKGSAEGDTPQARASRRAVLVVVLLVAAVFAGLGLYGWLGHTAGGSDRPDMSYPAR